MISEDGSGLSGLYHGRSFTCLYSFVRYRHFLLLPRHSNNSLYVHEDKATTRPYALLAQLHGVCVLLLARLSIVLQSPSTQSRMPTTTRTILDTSPSVIFQSL